MVFKKGKSFFNIKIKKSTNSKDIIYKDFCISLPGKYNITNALGAISVCYELGISIVNIRKGLKNTEAELFLHKSGVPLRTIDFQEKPKQQNLFGETFDEEFADECEGLCGVW